MLGISPRLRSNRPQTARFSKVMLSSTGTEGSNPPPSAAESVSPVNRGAVGERSPASPTSRDRRGRPSDRRVEREGLVHLLAGDRGFESLLLCNPVCPSSGICHLWVQRSAALSTQIP